MKNEQWRMGNGQWKIDKQQSTMNRTTTYLLGGLAAVGGILYFTVSQSGSFRNEWQS